MRGRSEMSILFQTKEQAEDSLRKLRTAMVALPPMWPVTDMRVQQINSKNEDGSYKWVVTGDYAAWP